MKLTDFFYYRSVNTPTDAECTKLDPLSKDTDEKFKIQLCENKDLAKKYVDMSGLNAGAGERLVDNTSAYNDIFISTVNLGIGCVCVIASIIWL